MSRDRARSAAEATADCGLPPLEEYLDECRALVTDEICRLFGESPALREPLYDLILDYPLREGKGLRPCLTIATCRALGGDLTAVLPSAATLELYHNAFLIHDDVEDHSHVRRGKPTMHTDHGVPVAVNVGDAMLALSLQPLLDNTALVGLGPALRILETVARMTRESVEGQALELHWVRHNRWDLTADDYVEMVMKKTGWYSFVAPMRVGAIVAGADDDRLDDLLAFAEPLAIAFQIADDVLNLEAAGEGYGKEVAGDLWEGKRTLILLHALAHATPDERRRAVDLLARARPVGASPILSDVAGGLVVRGELTATGYTELLAAMESGGDTKTAADVEWLADLIRSRDSVAAARLVARRYAHLALEALDGMTWIRPSRHRAALEDLADYVAERAR